MRGAVRHDWSQRRRFWLGWMRNPKAVGAIVPSGRLLAGLMARDIVSGARVVELGAGTGSVTAALLEAGVRPEDLTIIEQSDDFADMLRERFPQSTVLQVDATALDEHCANLHGAVDYVVSSLPLMLFSAEQRAEVLRGAFRLLNAAGRFHQFTYVGPCPIDRSLREELALSVQWLGVAALNLPPAFVYRLQRS